MREYLSRKPYVSRTHANLIIENGELIVENLSGSNSTYINNVRMNLHERKTLTDGDEVAFGGYEKDGERQPEAAYFSVRIGPVMCTST